jgi:hypothetical protein
MQFMTITRYTPVTRRYTRRYTRASSMFTMVTAIRYTGIHYTHTHIYT